MNGRRVPGGRASCPPARGIVPRARHRATRPLPTATMAVLLLLAFPLCASTIISSALTGRVTAGGRAAAGVTVTVTSDALQQPRTTTTSARGTYFIPALPPGEYEVTFARSGLSALSRPALVLHGRVARADAALEPSEDEESVTSTARTVSMGDTTAITTTYSAEQLDRMPIARDPMSAAAIAPRSSDAFVAIVDGVPLTYPRFLGEEIFDDVTIFRGGLPADVDLQDEYLITARTRSGGEKLSLTLRDTLSGGEHLFETTSAGRIVPRKLWFFAAGWAGDSDFRSLRRARGLTLKLTAQIGASHNFVAQHTDGEVGDFFGRASTTGTGLHYTGVAGERLVVEALAGRWDSGFFGPGEPATVANGKASYVVRDHVLSAGASHFDGESAFFVNDRWSNGRFVVNAGVRGQHGDLLPRAGVTYDIRGNGRHALVANYGEYDSSGFLTIRVGSFGYVAALGQSGIARIDVQRREHDTRTVDSAQFDARYRLFDRFEFGGNYTHTDVDTNAISLAFPEHLANAWVSAQFPVGNHEFEATVLQRYSADRGANESPTDLALRYTVPVRRVALTLAGDVAGAFGDARRTRVWLRVAY